MTKSLLLRCLKIISSTAPNAEKLKKDKNWKYAEFYSKSISHIRFQLFVRLPDSDMGSELLILESNTINVVTKFAGHVAWIFSLSLVDLVKNWQQLPIYSFIPRIVPLAHTMCYLVDV